jgi:general secretion pathway protein D
VIGRLFSHTRDNTLRTEIVLLITPRLVRTLARPSVRSVEFAAGTEAQSGVAAGAPGFVPLPPIPGASVPAPAAPAQPVKPPSGADQVPFGGVKPTPD